MSTGDPSTNAPDLAQLLPPHEAHLKDIETNVLASTFVSTDEQAASLVNKIADRCDDLDGWKIKPEHRVRVIRELDKLTKVQNLRGVIKVLLTETIRLQQRLLQAEAVSNPEAQRVWDEATAPLAAKSPES